MKKNKKIFEELKRQLILKSIEKKKAIRIPLFDLDKIQFNGKGLMITQDMAEKTKLLNNESYLMVRKERYLQGLPNR